MIYLLNIFITIAILVLVIIIFVQVKKNSKETFADPPLTFKVLTEKPRITEIGNFLSSEECDHLIQLAENRQCFKRSGVHDGTHGGTQDDSRTSWSCILDQGEDEVVKRIEDRVASLSSMPRIHIEPFQIVRYQPGQFFKGHYDFYPPGGLGTEMAIAHRGQRLYTFFVYLNDVPGGGGHTHFPKVPIRVSPNKGNAVFWSNLHPDGTVDYSTYHEGEPPKSDVKYGLNIWIGQLPFKQ